MITEKAIRELVAQVVDGVLEAPPAPKRENLPEGATAAEKTIAVGADHGGFSLKEDLVGYLRREGYTITDCGTTSTEACDYPDFAHEVAKRVAGGFCRWGVIVDGAGIGSCMVANKVPGVRAALAYDLSSARNSREHNHANVLTLGSGLIGPSLARQIVQEWLSTPWGPDRHARRVEKITAVERQYSSRGER
jgi:ribose 5-phosphate isomerase B